MQWDACYLPIQRVGGPFDYFRRPVSEFGELVQSYLTSFSPRVHLFLLKSDLYRVGTCLHLLVSPDRFDVMKQFEVSLFFALLFVVTPAHYFADVVH